MSNFVLQNIIFPSVEINAPEDMYYRADHRVSRRFSEQLIQLEKGAITTFDTFFNSISVGVWKSNTSVSNLSLILNGLGNVIIRFGLHRIGHAHKWLSENKATLTKEGITIDMPFWEKLEDGMLYFQIEAISESVTINDGTFVTNDQPKTDVKLGVVITHFNRKQYVVPAIQRIESQLLNDPRYEGKIDLVVVDNSKNITQEEAGIKPIIIPNKNLGGSGGFTRGLLYLEDQKDYTHCLFMDDDASCEVESLRRTFAFLSFVTGDKVAFSGSMLRELEPYRLFEKGAQFNGMCRPLHVNKDMRSVHDLLTAEQTHSHVDYGGWWFFAFSLKDVSKYPFPFFVRGDDIMFSMLNKFNIISMNGICCWGDDFSLKSGPLPIYLDTRNHLLQLMLVKNAPRTQLLKTALHFFIASAFSYNYETSRAVLLAIKHVMSGPEFWKENIDMSEVRKEIAAFVNHEKMQKINRSEHNPCYSYQSSENKLRTIFRWLTLNGHLLPDFMLKRGVVFQHKGFRGLFREIFGFKHVLYEYEPLKLGYLVTQNKREFLSQTKVFIKSSILFYIKFSELKNNYINSFDYLTSRKFWVNVYSPKE